MSFFHVVVKTKDNDKSLCIFKDLPKTELRKKFVKPYKLGKKLFYVGNILPVSELTNIKIILTAKNHEQELKVVQEESLKEVEEFNNSGSGVVLISAGHGYQDYEIEECGVDVTNKFIAEAPGEGTSLSRFSETLKHPWVVRVFAGLFFTLVLIYLGIK